MMTDEIIDSTELEPITQQERDEALAVLVEQFDTFEDFCAMAEAFGCTEASK
jgi:hypothetical protein